MPGLTAHSMLHGPGIWIAGSILTNPSDATVLGDSGELLQGTYLIATTVNATGAAKYRVLILSQDLGTVRYSQRRSVAADSNDDYQIGNKVPILGGDHIRVIMDGTVSGGGTIQASIHYMEVG